MEELEKISKDVNEMTKEDFEALPDRHWNEELGPFDSLVIIPMEEIHDSGFCCMDFVAVSGNMAICKLAGGSDLIHVEGIGGMGPRAYLRFTMNRESPMGSEAWSLDCLKVSGYMRLFPMQPFRITVGAATSSFEVFSVMENPFDKKP